MKIVNANGEIFICVNPVDIGNCVGFVLNQGKGFAEGIFDGGKAFMRAFAEGDADIWVHEGADVFPLLRG